MKTTSLGLVALLLLAGLVTAQAEKAPKQAKTIPVWEASLKGIAG